MSVKQGTTLVIGRWYRITVIDPTDPDPSLKVGDIVRCAEMEKGCIDPESMISDGMGVEWFADYDAREGSFRTLVNDVEEVLAPEQAS